MMEVKMYLFNSAERVIFNGALDQIEQLRLSTQTAAGGEAAAGQRVPEAAEVGEVKPAQKRTKKTQEPTMGQRIAENAAIAAQVPATPPEPATAPVSAPAAAPAAPSQSKVQLEDKVRLLAKTNFAAVKALLAKYGVERFGKLAEDKYATFGPELFALPEYPPVVA